MILTEALGSLTSEQDAILEGTRHPVDDESPVVAERGEEPGVGRRPLGGIHAVLVLLVGGHHAVFQRLLAPAKKGTGLKLVELRPHPPTEVETVRL